VRGSQYTEVKKMEDSNIVELYWTRSENAISETAKKYGRYCHSIARNILFNKEDADEAVNDTYLGAWNSMPPHRPSVLATFLGKITRRISLNKWRYQNRDKRGGGEVALALDELEDCIASKAVLEQEIETKELGEKIDTFINTLPETERRVFVCRYWYLDQISAICEQFGFSQEKVKSMLFRTRKKLLEYLITEGYVNE
jgi:RNA polymerase sigma-70 factor (ECF subfamily)